MSILKVFLYPVTTLKVWTFSSLHYLPWYQMEVSGSLPRSRELVISFSPRKSGLNARSVHVESVVEKVALGQVLFWVLQFSALSFHQCSTSTFQSPATNTIWTLQLVALLNKKFSSFSPTHAPATLPLGKASLASIREG